jgi:hypothetical protein
MLNTFNVGRICTKIIVWVLVDDDDDIIDDDDNNINL